MYNRKQKPDIRCPLDFGMSLIGGKWKPRILCVLGVCGQLRYRELMKQMENVTDAVLSAALKELVRDGLLERIPFPEIPPRVEYRLTERGKSVLPILGSLARWAGGCSRPAGEDGGLCSRCDHAEGGSHDPSL